ncbi:cellobiose dehydrogenase [Marssonina coronariae]|uniref:Cellobiose dehydrogenase n=1 Tax=Diplocarpon coronariae TaxID=2795749 RepID=A0A218ZDY0_9HELO|nr:cellobiose dehydrogenase [Marssonina coronariae]
MSANRLVSTLAIGLGLIVESYAQYNTTSLPVSNSTYDYIVVGGGPAGLVSSQRLTETGKTVLLIERGGPSTASSGGTHLGGCILGGGGSINGMAFIHPTSFDFNDAWPETWKWDDVEEASERLYARNPGTLLPSADGKVYDRASIDLMEPIFKEAGWVYNDGFANPDNKEKVYGRPQVNIANGIRSGPIHTYLPLAQASPNFKLELNTKVIRVVRTGSLITGVEVENAAGRQIINLKTGGAVILTAGVMSTPRVLFNSAIGPAAQINIVKAAETGITVPESDWINLPVGLGVKDHSRYYIRFNVTGGLSVKTTPELLAPTEEEKQLFYAGSGVLTQSFQRLDLYRAHTTSDGHKIYFQIHCSSRTKDVVELMIMISHGITSVGELGILPNGNTAFIKKPWTNTDTDREAWALALDEFLDLARKPNSPIVYTGGPNATSASILSAEPQDVVHMVGTARIGTDDGRTGGSAVVDLDTKVYGTDNLFVIDASIHPDVPVGNTQAIVMVVAERAVERIVALRGESMKPADVPASYPTNEPSEPDCQ